MNSRRPVRLKYKDIYQLLEQYDKNKNYWHRRNGDHEGIKKLKFFSLNDDRDVSSEALFKIISVLISSHIQQDNSAKFVVTDLTEKIGKELLEAAAALNASARLTYRTLEMMRQRISNGYPWTTANEALNILIKTDEKTLGHKFYTHTVLDLLAKNADAAKVVEVYIYLVSKKKYTRQHFDVAMAYSWRPLEHFLEGLTKVHDMHTERRFLEVMKFEKTAKYDPLDVADALTILRKAGVIEVEDMYTVFSKQEFILERATALIALKSQGLLNEERRARLAQLDSQAGLMNAVSAESVAQESAYKQRFFMREKTKKESEQWVARQAVVRSR